MAFLELEIEGESFDARLKKIALLREGGVAKVFRGSEKKMLASFLQAVKDVDLLVTWGGESTDYPILTAKALRNNVNPSPLHECFHLDLKQFIEKVFAKQNISIEQAAEILRIKKGRSKAETIAKIFSKFRSLLRTLRPELGI